MSRRIGAYVLYLAGVTAVIYGWVNPIDGVWAQLHLGLGGLAFGVVGLVLALRSGVPDRLALPHGSGAHGTQPRLPAGRQWTNDFSSGGASRISFGSTAVTSLALGRSSLGSRHRGEARS